MVGQSIGPLMANLALATSLLVLLGTLLFADNPYVFSFGAKLPFQAPMISRLRVAAWRPLLGAAVAVFIVLCAEGNAPRVAGLLAKPAFHVFGGLSYSMYLLQFAGQRFVEAPYALAIADALNGAPLWLMALAVYGGVALIILGTAPLGFLNYALVERPGILVGKWSLEWCSRISRRTTDGAPSGSSESMTHQEQGDLEACSKDDSAEVSTEGDPSEVPTLTDPSESVSGNTCPSELSGGGSRARPM